MPVQKYTALFFTVLTLAAALPHPVSAQTGPALTSLPAAGASEIDLLVEEVLSQSQAPSVSIAVVLNGRIAYAKAYGRARLSPDIPATVETRYGIASVSKQFTAAAILLLAKEGKLKIEDPVRRYISGLPESDQVTIRHILSHTSGYRDYWPHDYVPPFMLKPTTPEAIIDQWVRRAPDFPPGSEWQYSNSNYVVAGQIVEKVSGQPLMRFLGERIFSPLRMVHVDEDDSKALAPPDAAGYTKVALGPVRPALKEGPGWLYAAGQLALPPSDLALWNISMIEGSLLSAEGYRAMFQHGLGVMIKDDGGKRLIRHGGWISGTATENRVWPEQRAAVSVMVNADWGELPGVIADRIGHVIFPPVGPDAGAKALFVALQQGKVDPAQLTENARSYFTAEALQDAAQGLSGLGSLRILKRLSEGHRGGFIQREYQIVCARGAVKVTAFCTADGKFEQFNINPIFR